MSKAPKKEEFKVSGEEVVAKIKQIIKAGNVRRIILKNDKDKVLLEIPLTFAVVGAVLAPMLAAVGAMAALLTKCTIVVERKD
jgi:integral membrane sensor domain MASE1